MDERDVYVYVDSMKVRKKRMQWSGWFRVSGGERERVHKAITKLPILKHVSVDTVCRMSV